MWRANDHLTLRSLWSLLNCHYDCYDCESYLAFIHTVTHYYIEAVALEIVNNSAYVTIATDIFNHA